ncbi:MAG: ArgR family transcriptional regulator [Bombilactobacillus mellifer]|nr:ArgR family transcriptional regulator [Bombilactobacillus mellifer]
MLKAERQNEIRKLIKNNKISKHSQLVQLLADKGMHFTQATISRDIHEMNIVKVASEHNGYIYVLPEESENGLERKAGQIISESMVSLESQQFIVIVKTVPGYAQALGSLLDQLVFPEVRGLLAGDDTIFMVTKSNHDSLVLIKKINSLGAGNARHTHY